MPFRGESSGVIFNAILERAPVPAVRLNPDLPLELARIINRAIEKDRELRYQHATDMRSELQRLKRDTETGRAVAPSSGSAAVAQDAAPKPVAPGSAPAAVPLIGGFIAATGGFCSSRQKTLEDSWFPRSC